MLVIGGVGALVGAIAMLAPRAVLRSKGVAPEPAPIVWMRQTGALILASSVVVFLARGEPASGALAAVLWGNALLHACMFPIEIVAWRRGVIRALAPSFRIRSCTRSRASGSPCWRSRPEWRSREGGPPLRAPAVVRVRVRVRDPRSRTRACPCPRACPSPSPSPASVAESASESVALTTPCHRRTPVAPAEGHAGSRLDHGEASRRMIAEMASDPDV